MMIAYTPWGLPDRERTIADGIVFYSTPSHGGIHLSDIRMAEFRQMFPDFKPFRADNVGWFEEDCDWAYVALRWPEHFTPEQVKDALNIASAEWSGNAKVFKRWSETDYGKQMLGPQPTPATVCTEDLDDRDEERQ